MFLLKKGICYLYDIKESKLNELDKSACLTTVLNSIPNANSYQKQQTYQKYISRNYLDIAKDFDFKLLSKNIYGGQLSNTSFIFICINKTKEDLENYLYAHPQFNYKQIQNNIDTFRSRVSTEGITKIYELYNGALSRVYNEKLIEWANRNRTMNNIYRINGKVYYIGSANEETAFQLLKKYSL